MTKVVTQEYERQGAFETASLFLLMDTSETLAPAGVFKIVETMLTKQKFKDFFNKNVAAL